MARRGRMTKYMRTTHKGAAKPGKPEVPEDAVIFGTGRSVKGVIIMALVFGILPAGVFLFAFRDNLQNSLGGVLSILVFGGLLGMVVGQMMFVYPYTQLVVPTLTMMFFAIVIWFMAFLMRADWQVTRQNLPALVGLLFVFAFIGYWIGYWFYQKKLRERKRFAARQRSHVTDETQA